MDRFLDEDSCIKILLSWVFIVVGFYAYNKSGLFLSFFPFLVAALLRGDHDKSLKIYFSDNNLIKLLFAIYYVSFMLVVVFINGIFQSGLGYKFALYLSLPVVILAAVNDVKTCASQK